MATNPLHPLRYLHTIHAAPECDRLRQVYCDVFGGLSFSENYYPPEDRDAVLLYVADHMIEVMAPRHTDDLGFMYARYLQKTGPSYHSISFRVADCEAAHARCNERDILINTTGPQLIYLHPKSTGGIIMELTSHFMPNDPWDLPHWRRDWATGRPDRPHALAHLVCAPRFPARAIEFLVESMDGKPGATSELGWPQPARATPVDVADITLLILEPVDTSTGPLVDFASGPNSGVYALAWRLADPAAGADWFGRNGLEPTKVEDGGPYSYELLLDGARHWLTD